MSTDRRPKHGGPLVVWGDDLVDWLARMDCSPERCSRAVSAFWRFSLWMADRGLDETVLDEDLVDEYVCAEQERSGSRFPAAFQYLPLVKRFFAAGEVMVLRGPASRDLGGIPRLDAGPLSRVVVDLVSWQRAEGYNRGTIASVACTAARLGAWMQRSGRSIEDLDEETLERFVTAQTRGPRRHPSSARRIVTIRKFLSAAGLLADAEAPGPEVVTPVEVCLQDLGSWLVRERGDGRGWICEARRWVRPFLEQMTGADGQVQWLDVDAGAVNSYVTSEGQGYSLSSRRHLVSAMRMLVRWALVTGRIEKDISAGILAPRRSSTDVPRGLTAGQVEQILAAADRASGKGLRDFALVVLIWRLGLRAGEAAGLRLDDVDWHHGQLTVQGKGGRVMTLPLPADVGQALVDFLRAGRPDNAHDRAVFLRSRPPIIGLSGKGVSSVVAALARRAGLGTIHAHRLRHTTATAVLTAGGSLVEARELLGHARTDTTMTYARTDLDALRGLSAEWGRVA